MEPTSDKKHATGRDLKQIYKGRRPTSSFYFRHLIWLPPQLLLISSRPESGTCSHFLCQNIAKFEALIRRIFSILYIDLFWKNILVLVIPLMTFQKFYSLILFRPLSHWYCFSFHAYNDWEEKLDPIFPLNSLFEVLPDEAIYS